MIEIHLLRYALAAADTGSFRQAADQFRIKQSTLSRHILYLEQRLALSIFASFLDHLARKFGCDGHPPDADDLQPS